MKTLPPPLHSPCCTRSTSRAGPVGVPVGSVIRRRRKEVRNRRQASRCFPRIPDGAPTATSKTRPSSSSDGGVARGRRCLRRRVARRQRERCRPSRGGGRIRVTQTPEWPSCSSPSERGRLLRPKDRRTRNALVPSVVRRPMAVGELTSADEQRRVRV